MIVTGALSEPSITSPFGPASARSADEAVVSSARAGVENGSSAADTPVPTRVKAAPANSNSRRLSVTGGGSWFEREIEEFLAQECGISAPGSQAPCYAPAATGFTAV